MKNILFPFENREKLIERLFVENTKLLERLQELTEKYNGLVGIKWISISKEDYRIISFNFSDTFTLYELNGIFEFAVENARSMAALGMKRAYLEYMSEGHCFTLCIVLQE